MKIFERSACRHHFRVFYILTGSLLLTAFVMVWFLPADQGTAPVLRVGTSGDYAPFSMRLSERPDVLEGFDIAVTQAYAAERGLSVEFVRFKWPELIANLRDGAFDVAASGITVRPERSIVGQFTVPVAKSSALALVRADSGIRDINDLYEPGIRLVVNRGGHLESITRSIFLRAVVVAVPNNHKVLPMLLGNRVDAAITDTLEAPLWKKQEPTLREVGPLTRDVKAYLVRSGRDDLAKDIDSWLLAQETNGSLSRLRRRHFGPGADEPTATPLRALFAAVNERLQLMTSVAQAKKRLDLPIRDPEREVRVLAEATSAARAAADRAGVSPLPDLAVQNLFRAMIEASVAVQISTFHSPSPSAAGTFDLDSELRPAILRIGERIVEYLVLLHQPEERALFRHLALTELQAPGLKRQHVIAIADALTELVGTPGQTQRPGRSPEIPGSRLSRLSLESGLP